MSRVAGFTLVELAVVLTIIGILLVVAMPAMQVLLLDARRTYALNAVLHGLRTARVESIRSSADVVLCPTAGEDRCSDPDGAWTGGWMVFVNSDGDNPPVRDDGERILLRHQDETAGTLAANRARFVYRPYARRTTAGTLVYCDRRGPSAARAVIVSYTGRPRIAAEDASGNALACSG
jgi:type IV fimbrial biogenesis protein FimT